MAQAEVKFDNPLQALVYGFLELRHTANLGGATIQRLAHILDMHPAHVHALLNQLTRKGLVVPLEVDWNEFDSQRRLARVWHVVKGARC